MNFDSAMASTVPAGSQPLYNVNLPYLNWTNEGESRGRHNRRRSIKSPSRRLNTSPASHRRHSPLRDSVSATPPRLQSSFQDSVALLSGESPVHGDRSIRQPPLRGESSKPSPVRESMKQLLIGCVSDRQSFLRGESGRQSEALSTSKGALIECRRSHSRNSAFDSIRNGVYSSNSDQCKKHLEKKSDRAEADQAGSKRSKILIKIPCKNNKQEQENPKDEPMKIYDNGEHGERQEEGKTNNNTAEETKTWNLRPRKPLCKPYSASRMPEKGKAQPSMNANRSGENGGQRGGGCETKEKRELSISVTLSKEEIEEDIFAITRSKPTRRPKKRAKNIQKQLDLVFPGLCLLSITPDSYKVSETYRKA